MVGDTINVAGVNGVFAEVKLAYTTLINEDGIKITIPNKHIVGEILHNSGGYRSVEGSVGISYADDPEKAVNVIKTTLTASIDVTDEPDCQVSIENFGDSSVDIGYRYWVPSQKYFRTMYATNMAVYNSLKKAGITIPFPQREVLVKKESS